MGFELQRHDSMKAAKARVSKSAVATGTMQCVPCLEQAWWWRLWLWDYQSEFWLLVRMQPAGLGGEEICVFSEPQSRQFQFNDRIPPVNAQASDSQSSHSARDLHMETGSRMTSEIATALACQM